MRLEHHQTTLAALAEPYEEWSMLDRLNRLEKLGFLEVSDWLRWRETRNRPAHEYPDDPAVRFATLLSAVNTASELVACYQRWVEPLCAAPISPQPQRFRISIE